MELNSINGGHQSPELSGSICGDFSKANITATKDNSLSRLSNCDCRIKDFDHVVRIDSQRTRQLQIAIDNCSVARIDRNFKVRCVGRRLCAADNTLNIHNGSLQSDQAIGFDESGRLRNCQVPVHCVEFQASQIGAAGTEHSIKHDVVVTGDNNVATSARGIQMTGAVDLNTHLPRHSLRSGRQENVLICRQITANSQGLCCRQVNVRTRSARND